MKIWLWRFANVIFWLASAAAIFLIAIMFLPESPSNDPQDLPGDGMYFFNVIGALFIMGACLAVSGLGTNDCV